MAGPLDSTYGIWLITLFLQTILYGMGLLQAYFFWYGKDARVLKIAVGPLLRTNFGELTAIPQVIIVVFLESFQLATLFASTYHYLIDGFGNFPQLLEIYWLSLCQLAAAYLSAFVVQVYFAYSIYRLGSGEKILPFAILICSLAALGQVVVAADLVSYAQLDEVKSTTVVNASCSVLSDVLITAGLSWRLHSARTGIQATNNLLNYMIMFAINRGALTMTTAILELILFFALPGTFYFFGMIWFTGKLYMNSMLATLNTRSHASSRLHGGGERIAMGSVSGSESQRNNAIPGRVQVKVTTEDTKRDAIDGKYVL
ncbi:hypothetical protein B0H13DRAFT_2360851 [Mycena leptocephala]|nr:hypothetical protein B0H13DRAFT_2360851 [Mycena leptocephala]